MRYAGQCHAWAVLAVLLAAAAPAAGQPAAQKGQDPVRSRGTSYEELYRRYLEAARATEPGPEAAIAWMTSLGSDPRARQVNDLITVKVVESISAAGTADSTLTKDSTASAGVPKLFGLEKKLPGSVDPSKLASLSSNSNFEGAGATTRTGELTATMTARVSEVLPNGDLVLEGAREIDINGDRQIVVLNGVVRPPDIGRDNVVLSTQVGQLSIRYFGNGLMKDNLKPGFLVRLLNRIF